MDVKFVFGVKVFIYDKLKVQNITSNMINLYEGYWRPNYLSDYTESCDKSPGFCKGGWEVGDNSCSLGCKGALCEMCDIYDERGEGRFFKNQEDLKCSSCSQHDNIILPFLFALFQALLSIILSLKSINRSNQLFTSLRIFENFSKIIFLLNQDHEGILVKMLLNYLWIFSVIFTFNINFTFSVIFIEQSSNSFYFIVNNLDCYLSNFQTELIYIKIIVILIMMLLQFNMILAFSFLYHSITKNKMDNSLLSNTLLCLYLFNYGGFIKMYCSLLSSRKYQTLFTFKEMYLYYMIQKIINSGFILQLYHYYQFLVVLYHFRYFCQLSSKEIFLIKLNQENIYAIYLMNILIVIIIGNRLN